MCSAEALIQQESYTLELKYAHTKIRNEIDNYQRSSEKEEKWWYTVAWALFDCYSNNLDIIV